MTILDRALVERRVALRADVTVHRRDEGAELEHPWGCTRLAGVGPGLVAGLAALTDSYLSDAGLAERVADGRAVTDPRSLTDLAQLYTLLASVPPLVRTAVFSAGAAVVEVVPMSERAEAPKPGPVPVGATVGLPRHAYFRRLPGPSGTLVLESPLSLYRAEWHDPETLSGVMAVAMPGGASRSTEEGRPSAPGDRPFDRSVRHLVLELLVGVGLLSASPGFDKSESPALAVWDFHDLLFHSRSRPGRHDYPFGGLFRHRDVLPPLPAVEPPPPSPPIDLDKPSWAETLRSDPRLSEALEGRRSIRSYGAEAITRDQLAELLYRSMRVRAIIPISSVAPYDASDRPFPTGGGAGDLEIYATVARCGGLDAGIYHYDAAGHQLRPVAHAEMDRRRLLLAASQATGGTAEPQVLLTITSRFGRLSWKYSSIAYAATLKHVGVLYQTLYLVATAMGLAPCGLGSGNPDDSARAFGLDWTEESSVGEFLIGSAGPDRLAPNGFADIVERTRADRGGAQVARIRPPSTASTAPVT